MLKDIVTAKALGDYRLHLQFEDGVEGAVDLEPHLSFRGVFEPARPRLFRAGSRRSGIGYRSLAEWGGP